MPTDGAADALSDHHGRLEKAEYLLALCLVSSHLFYFPAPVVQARAFWRRSTSTVVFYTARQARASLVSTTFHHLFRAILAGPGTGHSVPHGPQGCAGAMLLYTGGP
jgi:hypothetical protein